MSVGREIIRLPDKGSQQLAIRRGQGYKAETVPHLDLEAINLIAKALKPRDGLLVRLLFDGCLRASESIGVRARDIVGGSGGWSVRVVGKGGKRAEVAISPSLAAQLKAYAYDKGLSPEARLFPITRFRVHQIVKGAMSQLGIVKPDGVGSVHVLRHSGAIERLRRTGNPRSVQAQLRHSTVLMTLRYMKTLSDQEALAIQQGVDFGW